MNAAPRLCGALVLVLVAACGSEPAEPDAPAGETTDPDEADGAREEPTGKSVDQQAVEALERARASTPKTAVSFFRPPDAGLRVERLDREPSEERPVVASFALPDEWELPETGAVVHWSGFVDVPTADVWAVAVDGGGTVRLALAEELLVDTGATDEARDAGALALRQGWHALRIEWEPAPGDALPTVRLAPQEGTWMPLDALELAH